MEGQVRERLIDAHADALKSTLACADAVAAGWDGSMTTDRSDVVGPYRVTLEQAGLPEQLLSALEDAVEVSGGEIAADPVPDIPYFAVTSRGVVLRAPTTTGRVVVTLAAFEIDPYRRGESLPAALKVEIVNR